MICAWTNGWVNNRDAGDLRHHCAYYDVSLIIGAYMLYSELGRYCFRLMFIVYCLFSAKSLPETKPPPQPPTPIPNHAFQSIRERPLSPPHPHLSHPHPNCYEFGRHVCNTVLDVPVKYQCDTDLPIVLLRDFAKSHTMILLYRIFNRVPGSVEVSTHIPARVTSEARDVPSEAQRRPEWQERTVADPISDRLSVNPWTAGTFFFKR